MADKLSAAAQRTLDAIDLADDLRRTLTQQAEPVQPVCWCHTCNAGQTVNGMPFAATRMIVCPDCGNKRCPRANDHQLACTNSNEPVRTRAEAMRDMVATSERAGLYELTAEPVQPIDEALDGR